MRFILNRKIELLSLLDKKGSLTFIEVDGLLNESEPWRFEPDHFLYDKGSFVWVFFHEKNAAVVCELLSSGAVELKPVPTINYGYANPGVALSKKLTLLIPCYVWVPTVLVKGAKFNDEWESNLYVTSREVKKPN